MKKNTKNTIITGGAVRIGANIARKLVLNGHKVIIHYNNSKKNAQLLLNELNQEGQNAFMLKADLSKEKEVKKLFDLSKKKLGSINCIINNASAFRYDNIKSVSYDSWNEHMQPNLRAPLILAKELYNHLPFKSNANIINIIDQRVLNLTPHFLSYTISKSALWTLTKTLAMDLAPKVRVNAIGPGPTIKSEFQSEKEFQNQCRRMPLKIGATPDEVSETIIYILKIPSITGQMIALDGGQHLGWGQVEKRMYLDD